MLSIFKHRYLFNSIKYLALDRKKMAFISGPRQVGKTTLSKSFKEEFDEFIYKNWDESSFRKIWMRSPNSLQIEFSIEKPKLQKCLVLDEIHKSSLWKQKLKGLYDVLGQELKFLVTGSARLNIFKKGGDSLMGRFVNFRLHPLSYGEVIGLKTHAPDEWRDSLFRKSDFEYDPGPLLQLLKLSGFPEPYYANSEKILRIWRMGRNEKIVKEDLRDLSRLPDLAKVEMLATLLPEKVGSPLSVQSLREDLEVSHDTVTRWLNYLRDLFFFFEIKPWSKSIKRALKKEGKIYLYDWTEIPNQGAKFENLVAAHLLKACHFWTDTGEGKFDLHYIRNKDKQEIDFLIVKDTKPWLCLEAKISDVQIDVKTTVKFLNQLKCPFVQIVLDDSVWKLEKISSDESPKMMVASATRVFAHLP